MKRLPLVVAAAAFSLLATACSASAGGQPAVVAPSSSAEGSTPTQTPSPAFVQTIPAPKPKPKPVNPALSFGGDYKVQTTVTKTNTGGNRRKGKVTTTDWTVSSRRAKKCTSRVVTRFVGQDFTMVYRAKRWRGTVTYKVGCVYTDTGKRAGPDVRFRQSWVLKKTRSRRAVATRLEGTLHLRQLDECGGFDNVHYRAVLTHR